MWNVGGLHPGMTCQPQHLAGWAAFGAQGLAWVEGPELYDDDELLLEPGDSPEWVDAVLGGVYVQGDWELVPYYDLGGLASVRLQAPGLPSGPTVHLYDLDEPLDFTPRRVRAGGRDPGPPPFPGRPGAPVPRTPLGPRLVASARQPVPPG